MSNRDRDEIFKLIEQECNKFQQLLQEYYLLEQDVVKYQQEQERLKRKKLEQKTDRLQKYYLDQACRDLEIEACKASLILERDEILKNASAEFIRGWNTSCDFRDKYDKLMFEVFDNHKY